MSFLSQNIHWERIETRQAALVAVLTLVIALVGGLTAVSQPLLGIALILLAPVALGIVARPDVATMLVLFILYSNAAVVAVYFHNVPYFVAVTFPALLIIPLIYYLLIRRQPIIITSVLPLLVVYLGIQLVSALFSRNIDQAFPELINYGIEGIGLYFLITNVVRTPQMLRRSIWVLLAAGVILAAVPLYQQLTGTFDNDFGGFGQIAQTGFRTGEETLQGEVRQPRLAGAIGEQNRFAQLLLMLVPLALFRFWGEQNGFLRLLGLGAAGLISLGVVLAFSRGAAVGYVLMLIIMAFLRVIRPVQLGVILLGTALLLIALPQYSARLTSIQEATALVGDEPVGTSVDGAIRGRATEMIAAALVFRDHPIIGVGPGMFRFYSREYGNQLGLRMLEGNREAHSLYLEVAANLGILGLISFLAIVGVTLRDLLRARERWQASRPEIANITTGFFLAILSYLTTGMFLHLSYARYFWLMMALAGAAAYIAFNTDFEEERYAD